MMRTLKTITAALILIPIIYMAVWSFTVIMPWPGLLPEHISFDVWKQLLGSTDYLKSTGISIAVSICTAVVCIIVAVPTAYVITCFDFSCKPVVRGMIYFPFFIPSISLSMGIHSTFLYAGITDSFAGVVFSHLIPCLPYAIMVLEGSFGQMGRGLDEQGRNLGAGLIQLFAMVYLPNMKSSIYLSAALAFVVSFSQYLLTFLVGGGIIKTLPVVLFQIMQNGNRTEISAYSLGFVMLGAFCTFLMKKYLEQENKMKFMI